jgi:cytochrome c biogenesis factor
MLIGLAVTAAIALFSLLARIPRAFEPVAHAARRRHPSLSTYVLYAGFAALLGGLAATRWWTSVSVSLGAGASAEMTDTFGGRWRFVSQGVSRDQGMNYLATGLALEAWRGADRVGIINSEERQYFDSMQRPTFEPSTKPGIRSFARFDVYVTLMEVRGEVAQVRIGFHPLVASVWLGWLLVIVGGVSAAARWVWHRSVLAKPAPTRAE